jgi:hypothetical protein
MAHRAVAIVLVGFCLSMVAFARPASAILVRVDWSADIPALPAPDAGPGRVSGSLGMFNVTGAGEIFLLPADGTLTAVASGFVDGFPNGVYPFTRNFSAGGHNYNF